jgi:hypothetical protein
MEKLLCPKRINILVGSKETACSVSVLCGPSPSIQTTFLGSVKFLLGWATESEKAKFNIDLRWEINAYDIYCLTNIPANGYNGVRDTSE